MKSITKISMLVAFTVAFSFCMPALAAEAATWKTVAKIVIAILGALL